MLTTKRINLGISMASRILRLTIIFYSAIILAKCFWWVFSPADNNIFIQWADLDVHDKATSYINNRNPFGIVVIAKPKAPEKPKVADQLKLTGVYLNTKNDSFAFLEYSGKHIVVRAGGEIANSGAIVKQVNADNIIVFADDQDVTIKVTSGTGEQSGLSNSNNNTPSGMFGNRGSNDVTNNMNSNNSEAPEANKNAEEFKQQRRRIMDEFNNARNNHGRDKEGSARAEEEPGK